MDKTTEFPWQGPGRYHLLCAAKYWPMDYHTLFMMGKVDEDYKDKHYFADCETPNDLEDQIKALDPYRVTLVAPKGTKAKFEVGKSYEDTTHVLKCIKRTKKRIVFQDENGNYLGRRLNPPKAPDIIAIFGEEFCEAANPARILTCLDVTPNMARSRGYI